MKKIVVKDCLECPLIVDCKEVNELRPQVRFAMKTSTAVIGVLKTCPLPDDK